VRPILQSAAVHGRLPPAKRARRQLLRGVRSYLGPGRRVLGMLFAAFHPGAALPRSADGTPLRSPADRWALRGRRSNNPAPRTPSDPGRRRLERRRLRQLSDSQDARPSQPTQIEPSVWSREDLRTGLRTPGQRDRIQPREPGDAEVHLQKAPAAPHGHRSGTTMPLDRTSLHIS
jgi:hypothetical protein